MRGSVPPVGDRHADATRRSPRRVSCRGFGRRHVSPTCPLPAIAGGGDFAVRRNRRGFPAAPLPPPSLRFGAGTFPPWGDRYADATRRFPSMGDRYADAIRRFPSMGDRYADAIRRSPRRGEYTGFSESGGGGLCCGVPPYLRLRFASAQGPSPLGGTDMPTQHVAPPVGRECTGFSESGRGLCCGAPPYLRLRFASAQGPSPLMGDRYADAIRRSPRRGEYAGFGESGGRGAVLWGAPLPASDAAGPFPSMGNPILAQRAETRGSS